MICSKLELAQIRGVDDTTRITEADVKAGGRLVMYERLLTDDEQTAQSDVTVLIKLMTLGLTEEEAEEAIIGGFLK